MLSFISRLKNYFSQDLGIDLGTANTLVAQRGRGIIINEPSFVAILRDSKKAYRDKDGQIAVGEKAKDMLGRAGGKIEVIRPLKDGVISDYEITELMLSYFISKANGGKKNAMRVRMVIGVPAGINGVERRAVIESAERAGAKEVFLIDEPMAAGIGAGLPVQDATGSMIVDIGGGTTEVAVLALATMVTHQSVRCAGDKFNQTIINYVRNKHQFLIGEPWAEKVKILIGSAWPLEEEMRLTVRGRNLRTNRPDVIVLRSEEIRDALSEALSHIIKAIQGTLENTPPELCADLVDTGITLAGGGALLRGLDTAIENATGLPVRVAEAPLECVARGTGHALDNIELLAQIMQSEEDVNARRQN
ncbi:MAG: rod shape-determining protein [Planctomycetes bacterium]|nr:rod shape-determining protein [Planctomycetota bacterium]